MKITQEQVNNLIRHAGTSLGTIVTIAGFLAVLSANQSAEITSALNDVVNGLTQAFGGFWKIGVVVGPILITYMTKWGWHVVSPPGLVNGASNIPGVQVLVNEDAAPPTVVAMAKDKDVKDVVLDVQPSPSKVLPSLKNPPRPPVKGSSPR